jgi:hypothetical protein
MRRRRTEALAELLREFEQDRARAELRNRTEAEPEEVYEAVPVPPAPKPAPTRVAEPVTEELPPVRTREDHHADPGRGPARDRRAAARRVGGMDPRRAAVVVGVTAAALIGFGCALLVPGGD